MSADVDVCERYIRSPEPFRSLLLLGLAVLASVVLMCGARKL